MLYIGAFLLVFIGCVHSFLGEKYILQRLFKRDNLPKLFGGTGFTKSTLRFAWHLTTLAWFGFAAILVYLANPDNYLLSINEIISVTFLAHSLVALFASKGKHLSWIVFLLVSVFVFIA